MKTTDLTTDIGRLHLANPVCVASGTFGFAEEYAELIDVDLLGAVVTKGISIEVRRGNPAPRTAEVPAGLLNSVGLENPGVQDFIGEKLPRLSEFRPAVIANIIGNTIDDYARLSGMLNGLKGLDGLEVNISCPNVSQGGIAFGTDPEIAARVARAVVEETSLPVLVKLSPNVTDIVAVAKRVADVGVDGLTLINTLRAMAIDHETGVPLLGNVIGGLSGPAIRPVAVRVVFEVTRAVDIPVVGCGGIMNWRDAVEFIRAGASAVQVGSASFRNPSTCIEVLRGLEKFLVDNEYSSVRELVGTVQLPE